MQKAVLTIAQWSKVLDFYDVYLTELNALREAFPESDFNDLHDAHECVSRLPSINLNTLRFLEPFSQYWANRILLSE